MKKQLTKGQIQMYATLFELFPRERVLALMAQLREMIDSIPAIEGMYSAMPHVHDFLKRHGLTTVRELDADGWRELDEYLASELGRTAS